MLESREKYSRSTELWFMGVSGREEQKKERRRQREIYHVSNKHRRKKSHNLSAEAEVSFHNLQWFFVHMLYDYKYCPSIYKYI